MDSLQVTDAQSAAVATAPRVALADIEAAIAERHDFTASQALGALGAAHGADLRTLSMCIVTMKNGFVVTGVSRPVVADNFNADLGRKYAYEDAVRQLWPLMGYALRDRLASHG